MQYCKNKNKAGFVLMEVVIACAIIAVATFVLVSSGQKGMALSSRALNQTQASYLLEEGAESVKSIRDGSWTNISNLTLDTVYYLSYDTGTNVWSLTTTPSTIDSIFTRTIVLSAVNRDANEDITDSGGTTDTRTKKVVVTVSWPASSGTVSKTLTFYLVDIFT